MARLKYLIYYLAVLMLTIVVSCKSGHSTDSDRLKSYKNIHVIMNSPYTCYNEIQLDQNGSGISVFGYRDQQTGKTNIESKNTFLIQTDSTRLKVDNLVNSIRNRTPVFSNRGLDLYQLVVEIDGRKYVDIIEEIIW